MKTRNKKGKTFIKPKENKNNKKGKELFINLEDTESETEKIDKDKNNIPPTSPKKKNVIKNYIDEKKGNKKLLGKKHKPIVEPNIDGDASEFNLTENKNKKKKKKNDKNKKVSGDSINNNYDSGQEHFPKIQNKKEKLDKNDNNIIIEDDENNEDENIVEFPYEFTEKIIEALSCGYCGGIYIKPFVINESRCEHIFCLRCILKMLDGKLMGECFKCKTRFSSIDIKYSEVTDFYVNAFFPQIVKITEKNQNELNKFIETEAEKYEEIKKEKEKNLICELKPFSENVPSHNRLPTIVEKYNKFIIKIKSEDDNIISTVKKEIIKKLNLKLKEEEIEIRIQGIEVTQLKTFRLLKYYLPPNLKEIFYYCKKGK